MAQEGFALLNADPQDAPVISVNSSEPSV